MNVAPTHMAALLLTLWMSNAEPCNLPLGSTNPGIPTIPASITTVFCHPEPPFESFLLIRAALSSEVPVYRVISVVRGENGMISRVKVLQFLSDGRPHPPQHGQAQDEIIFDGSYPNFAGLIKGIKSTISFQESEFTFKMHRTFGGLTLQQKVNKQGQVVISEGSSQLLLIQTLRKRNWRWVLNDGTLADFIANRLLP